METLVLGTDSADALVFTEPLVLDHDDDGVLAVALALIDDVRATERERERRTLARRQRAAFYRNETQRLRGQVDELQHVLNNARQAHGIPSDANNLTRLWGRVALSQRRQRTTTEGEHAVLRATAKHQRALAARVTAYLDSIHAAIVHATPPRVDVRVRLGVRSTIAPRVLSCLDHVCDNLTSRAIETTRSPCQTHEIQWNATETAVRLRFRSRSLHPFKLSSVVQASWAMLQGKDAPAERLAADEVCFASARIGVRNSFGCMELDGPVVLRRTYSADGGVVLAGVSIRTGTERDDNLMAGLELHETVWMHAVRVHPASPTSPVFVETLSDLDVAVPPGVSVRDTVTRLRRLVEFMERSATAVKGRGQQELENRLLDVSASSKRADTCRA